MTLGGRAWRGPGATTPSDTGSDPLVAAATTVLEASFADALGRTLDADAVVSARAVLAAHDAVPLAQAARVVAALCVLPDARGVSWSRDLSGLAGSFPAVLSVDGVPRAGAAWGAFDDVAGPSVAPPAALARLLGAVALARIAARRAGAPFPGAVDRAFAAGVHFLALRTGVGTRGSPTCERDATWRDPVFLHALARAWGLLPSGAAHDDEDPRLRWFGVVPRRGTSVDTAAGRVPAPAPPVLRRASRARAEAGPTWDLHAFHAGGCVVAQEHGRAASRAVVACGATGGVALAWERGTATLLEGAVAGCDDATLLRARVDGRRLSVDGSGRIAGTRRAFLRSVRVQPGRWRILDRVDGAAGADAAVSVRLAWRFGAGWRIEGGRIRREGEAAVWEARACCGEEEILVQLPGVLDWVVTGGDGALEGRGAVVAGAFLASSFELRARGGTS